MPSIKQLAMEFANTFKGNQKLLLTLNNLHDVHPKDEILNYMRGRMITSMEATWRILGYDIYPPLFPSVHTIKLKSQEQVEQMNAKGIISELQIYLRRSPELANLTFKDFYQIYDYKTSKPKGNNIYYEEVFLDNILGVRNQNQKYYIYQLQRPRAVVRLGPIPWNCGEMWWLRMIILHKPVMTSIDNAKLVNNTRYETFQDAAVAWGLLEHTNEAEICFNGAINFETPPQLRSLFVVLTIQGFGTLQLYENFWSIMCAD
jgi:hypothetical protein